VVHRPINRRQVDGGNVNCRLHCVDDADTMRAANAKFGQLIYCRNTAHRTGSAWIGVGVLALGLAALIFWESKPTRTWNEYRSEMGRAQCAAGGLGILGVCFGIRRRFQARCAEEFYETGLSYHRHGRRRSLAYADLEKVTHNARMVEGQLERTLTLAGPGGNPTIHLRSCGEEATRAEASADEMEKVSTQVVKAVAERIVERVDRGEVVKWSDQMSIDPAGLRLNESAPVKFVSWPAIDGVKDGSQNGKIEVYAFGGQELVATAPASGVNALPCYEAFLRLLDRGQAAAKSMEPVEATAAPTSWAPGSREPRLRPR
jgi:hypothetical protein